MFLSFPDDGPLGRSSDGPSAITVSLGSVRNAFLSAPLPSSNALPSSSSTAMTFFRVNMDSIRSVDILSMVDPGRSLR